MLEVFLLAPRLKLNFVCLSATASVKMEVTKQKRHLDFALLKITNKSCGAGYGLGHGEAVQSFCCAK